MSEALAVQMKGLGDSAEFFGSPKTIRTSFYWISFMTGGSVNLRYKRLPLDTV